MGHELNVSRQVQVNVGDLHQSSITSSIKKKQLPLFLFLINIVSCFCLLCLWGKYKYNYCLFCPIWDYLGGLGVALWHPLLKTCLSPIGMVDIRNLRNAISKLFSGWNTLKMSYNELQIPQVVKGLLHSKSYRGDFKSLVTVRHSALNHREPSQPGRSH